MAHLTLKSALIIGLLTAGTGIDPALAADYQVKPAIIADLKAVYGTVQSADQVVARSRIAGTIEELTVDEGSVVKAGDVLATVKDPKLGLSKAAFASRVDSAQSQLKLAQTEYSRITKLRESGTVSQAAVDSARTKLEVAKSAVRSVERERDVVEQQQTEGEILAPVNGRVLKVRVTDGQVVNAGETIADIAAEQYVLRVELPERHARFLNEGDDVLVGARGLEPGEEQTTTGNVIQIYPEIKDGRVIADVAVEGLGDFFVGERTRVYVKSNERTALFVPVGFVYQKFGLNFVRVRDEGEVVVQLGAKRDGDVEILSGLKPGDILVSP